MLANANAPTIQPTRSELMSWFNRARASARKGNLDEQRVKNALSWLQKHERNSYHTTLKSCDCPDHCKRPELKCKHQISLMILTRIEQERKGKALQAQANTEKLSGKNYVEHTSADIGLAQQWTHKTWIEFIFATREQVQAFAAANPDVTLIDTKKARGRKVKFEDHRGDIV